jgi:multimeric flavodoxin WrbA
LTDRKVTTVKIVGIDGSGRGGGNTRVLIEAILEGAGESGAQTTLLTLADMDLSGCIACGACKKSHRCVVRDDMFRFYDLAPETDVIVLGTPIYFDHITAQMKAFLDRLYCYLDLDLNSYYPNENARVVVAITYAVGGESTYDYVAEWVAGRMKEYYRLETAATFAASACTRSPLIAADHPVVQKAREFGRTLA